MKVPKINFLIVSILSIVNLYANENNVICKDDSNLVDNVIDSFNPILKLSPIEAGFFIGEWKVLVKGTPNGDVVMNVVIEKKDDKYIGTVQSIGTDVKPVKADKVEIKENKMKIYWFGGGYNIFLHLEKIDDNKIEGSLMDMFDATGERIVN
ncbi:hypothetical protein [Tamlana flava]|uniref:hypothetical protein n=1 Tax=Tamlana flava TaxID=3158572 RepID=UPI00351BDF5E